MIAPAPVYIVLVGLPGSGKTTLRKAIQSAWRNTDARPLQVLSTDDYIDGRATLLSQTYSQTFPSAIEDAVHFLSEARRVALGRGFDVLHDQTNLTAKKRVGCLSGLPRGYFKLALVCHVAEDVRQERLAQRAGKDIPADVDRLMRDHWRQPICEEGFDRVATALLWRSVLADYLEPLTCMSG